MSLDKLKQRDSNIELLRIIATLFILIVHCNGWFLKMGGITGWNTGNEVVALCRVIIQNITCLGVDLFILISGFYGIRPKLKSIVNLFTLLLFFYVGCYIWECYIGNVNFSIKEMVLNALPFSRENWFINSYLLLFLLSPMINSFVDTATKKQLGIYLIVYSLCTLYFGHIMGNQYWFYNEGYSITMMISIYLVGRYMGKYLPEYREKINIFHLLCAFVAIIGLMSVIRIISSSEEAWLQYGSPITIIAAVLLFIIFYKIPCFHSRVINWIAISCLASFILHTCEPVFSWFVRKDILYFQNNIYPIYCVKIGAIIMGVFMLSIVLDKIRLFIVTPLLKLLEKK